LDIACCAELDARERTREQPQKRERNTSEEAFKTAEQVCEEVAQVLG
jgi:hypothetical protein